MHGSWNMHGNDALQPPQPTNVCWEHWRPSPISWLPRLLFWFAIPLFVVSMARLTFARPWQRPELRCHSGDMSS